MYQYSIDKFTLNHKGYLSQSLYVAWRFTLTTAIVFTTVSQVKSAQATEIREDIFAWSDLESNVTGDDISTIEDIFESGFGQPKQPKQQLISASSPQSDEGCKEKLETHQDNLRERLKAIRTPCEVVSRLRSVRQGGLNPSSASKNVTLLEPKSFNLSRNHFQASSNEHTKPSIPNGDNVAYSASLLKSAIPLQANQEQNNFAPKLVADIPPSNSEPSIGANNENSSPEEVDKILNQLRTVKETEIQPFFYSPSLSVYIPTGFGGDRNTGFISASYQQRGRFSGDDDAGLGFGVGLGDARKSVGVELSYTLASFGRNRDFGSGGFNVKVHRQLPDDWGVAVGWNGFLNVGDENNFQQSLYGVVTKIIRTQDSIDKPFSRVALTVGIGSGQFRTEDAVFDRNHNVNVFGNVAVRIAKPASFIVEWTGQDLGLGVSVAPFPNLPLVITPAVRDITGAGDGARFVLGTGFSFKL